MIYTLRADFLIGKGTGAGGGAVVSTSLGGSSPPSPGLGSGLLGQPVGGSFTRSEESGTATHDHAAHTRPPAAPHAAPAPTHGRAKPAPHTPMHRHPAAQTEHAKDIRRVFGHPHRAPAEPWNPHSGTAAPEDAPWNHRIGEPQALDVIHGTTRGVDKRLLNAVASGAAHLPPGYKVKVFSGYRHGDPGAHGRGQAIDVEVVDPKGNVIPSRGADRTGMYRRLARATYGEMKSRNPDLAKNKFAWGGSFGTQKGGGGVSDLMHFDIMKRRGGVRASHYPQIQQMGPLPLKERTLGAYLGHHPAGDASDAPPSVSLDGGVTAEKK